MITISNYIDGELTPPISGEYLDNYEPAIGAVYSRTPDSDTKDVEAAVQAAQSAFHGWSATTAAERAAVINRIADLIDANLPRLAQAESRDNGKPVSLAMEVEIPRAAKN
ncbi:aldehyde dehydrogenase family protein, partial [bacterium]|nr:aldehyde dehydrogenase family protein [bacterium]